MKINPKNVFLLISADLRNVYNQLSSYWFFAGFYIIFLGVFYLILYQSSIRLPPVGDRYILFFISYFFHFMLFIGIFEGVMSNTRLILRSDLDILFSMPFTQSEFFISRYISEIAVELIAFTPVIFTFITALSRYLDLTGRDIFYIIIIFWLFYILAEALRYSVDMFLVYVGFKWRNRVFGHYRAYFFGFLTLILIGVIAGFMSPNRISLVIGSYIIYLNERLYFLPSSLCIKYVFNIITGKIYYHYIFIYLSALILVDIVFNIFLASYVFDYEFLFSRITYQKRSFVQGIYDLKWLYLPRNLLSGLFKKDILLYLRSPLYHIQVITAFLIFLLMVLITTAFVKKNPYPKINFLMAVILELFAIWFIFMPAAEFSLAVEQKNRWIIRSLPLSRRKIIISKFLSNIGFNGLAALIVSLFISVKFTVGIFFLYSVFLSVSYIIYSAAVSLFVNIFFPTFIGRFQVNPVAVILYVIQFFIWIGIFVLLIKAFAANIIAFIGFLSWLLIIFSLAFLKISELQIFRDI